MHTDNDINELLGKLLEVATGLSRFQRSASEEPLLDELLPSVQFAGGSCDAGLTGIARQLLAEGDIRRRQVPDVPDHCWPLILDLYVRAAEGRRVSVTDACIAARAPHTTALRWIAELVDHGVLERAPDPSDKRRVFLTLDRKIIDSMSTYLAHVAGIEALVTHPQVHEKHRLQA